MTTKRIAGGSLCPSLIAAAVCAAFTSGCVTTNPNVNGGTSSNPLKEMFASDDPCSNNARNIGILAGALAGAFLGNQVKHSNTSRVLGAVAGGALGGLIGREIDNRRCELAKIAKKNNLEIQFEEIKATDQGVVTTAPRPKRETAGGGAPAQPEAAPLGLKVVLMDNGRQFQSGSDELNPDAHAYFGQIADQYSYDVQKKRLTPASSKEDIASVEGLREKRILLVGHTDDTGSSALNADLSERRAKAVAKVFRDRGINDEHIFFQGAGETLPIADNRTDEGRARNRRVEIIDLSDDTALRAYLASRKPTVAYYRNTQDKIAMASVGQAAASTASPGDAQEQTKQRAKRKDSAKGSSTVQKEASTSGQQVAAAPPRVPTIDFGGMAVGTKVAHVDIGRIPTSSGFSVISTAQADEPMAGSCLQDRPRISHGVKSLKSGQEYGIDDYMPGLYGTSWVDIVNGNLVALTHVTVLRDGGLPATRPTLLVYRDYDPKAKTKPSITETPEVNVYRGDKAVLYRVFSSSAPVRCVDVVIPNEQRTEARGSNLYYDRAQTLYVASFNPKLAK